MSEHWRVSIDHGACIGSGMCAASSPAFFRMAGGQAETVGPGEVPADDAVVDAAESCPGEAIRVVDAATGDLVAPLA